MLKMICNDFLVVKVNCWSYVFNIMKYMWLLRNVKNKNIVEKNVWKCAPMIRKWWRHTRKTTKPWTKQPIECWMLTTDRATTHRYDDKCRNRFLKHTLVKITSYRILIKRKRHKRILIWRHAWRWFPKNSYTKQTLKLFFLAFCGVIYQNLLHRRVYIPVSS